MRLDDELALLNSVFRAAGDRFHLIGHSYGGAIALKAALADRKRVLSLVLYETVLFSALIFLTLLIRKPKAAPPPDAAH